ncbi:MAG: clan AA aspartic protease [Treponema sp.]|nr:clan AA aspartic protease [Treponema sp.]
MGNVYAEITLKNAGDLVRVKDGYLEENKIRETTVNALVDTGAGTLVINEAIREELGLETSDNYSLVLANGEEIMVKQLDAVEIHCMNRKMICQPILLSGADEILLGAIPLEDMELIVDPKNEELGDRYTLTGKRRRI